MNVAERLSANAALVDAELKRLTDADDDDFALELSAERYSLLAPRAKRIRPTLVFEFCRLFGGEDTAALPFAAAVEMIHTYSLIHDDLPCMDDDDMRRGRPTCHKTYGEATALLAGDGLLTRAFGVAAANTAVDPTVTVAAIAALSRAAGDFGMIGGQVMDLAGERQKLPFESLLKLHAHKTGALISVSAKLGCLAAGIPEKDPRVAAAVRYASAIGLAFQIIDDILDATSDAETLGKSVGSDAASEKTTFLTYYNVEKARELAQKLTDDAKKAISGIAGCEFLTELADYLIKREY